MTKLLYKVARSFMKYADDEDMPKVTKISPFTEKMEYESREMHGNYGELMRALKAKYRSGEITKEQFKKIKNELEKNELRFHEPLDASRKNLFTKESAAKRAYYHSALHEEDQPDEDKENKEEKAHKAKLEEWRKRYEKENKKESAYKKWLLKKAIEEDEEEELGMSDMPFEFEQDEEFMEPKGPRVTKLPAFTEEDFRARNKYFDPSEYPDYDDEPEDEGDVEPESMFDNPRDINVDEYFGDELSEDLDEDLDDEDEDEDEEDISVIPDEPEFPEGDVDKQARKLLSMVKMASRYIRAGYETEVETLESKEDIEKELEDAYRSLRLYKQNLRRAKDPSYRHTKEEYPEIIAKNRDRIQERIDRLEEKLSNMTQVKAASRKGTEGAYFESIEDLPEEDEGMSLKETLRDADDPILGTSPKASRPMEDIPVEELDVSDIPPENDPFDVGDPGEFMPLAPEDKEKRLNTIKERHQKWLEGAGKDEPVDEEGEEFINQFPSGESEEEGDEDEDDEDDEDLDEDLDEDDDDEDDFEDE